MNKEDFEDVINELINIDPNKIIRTFDNRHGI